MWTGKFSGENVLGMRRQLCWDCRKFCMGCSWSESKGNIPVAGWTAKETYLLSGGEKLQTYEIYDCPEFAEDEHG